MCRGVRRCRRACGRGMRASRERATPPNRLRVFGGNGRRSVGHQVTCDLAARQTNSVGKSAQLLTPLLFVVLPDSGVYVRLLTVNAHVQRLAHEVLQTVDGVDRPALGDSVSHVTRYVLYVATTCGRGVAWAGRGRGVGGAWAWTRREHREQLRADMGCVRPLVEIRVPM